VSCSWNAWAPDSVSVPRRRFSSTEASKIAVPVRRVLANAVSSASMTVWMLAAMRPQLGYSPSIASSATEVSSCMNRSPVAGVAPAPPR
jgi:hypothetical protein